MPMQLCGAEARVKIITWVNMEDEEEDTSPHERIGIKTFSQLMANSWLFRKKRESFSLGRESHTQLNPSVNGAMNRYHVLILHMVLALVPTAPKVHLANSLVGGPT